MAQRATDPTSVAAAFTFSTFSFVFGSTSILTGSTGAPAVVGLAVGGAKVGSTACTFAVAKSSVYFFCSANITSLNASCPPANAVNAVKILPASVSLFASIGSFPRKENFCITSCTKNSILAGSFDAANASSYFCVSSSDAGEGGSFGDNTLDSRLFTIFNEVSPFTASSDD